MTYAELLKDARWVQKRNEIVFRDKSFCQKCFNEKLYKSGEIIKYINHNKHDKYFDALNYIKPIEKITGIDFPQNGILSIWENFSEGIKILGFTALSDSEIEEIHKKNLQNINSRKKYGIREEDLVKFLVDDLFEERSELQENAKDFKEENRAFLENHSNKNSYLQPNSLSNLDFKDWTNVSGLHVHHLYYKLRTKPWEYKDEALITLCWICHEEIHKNSTIDIYNEKGIKINSIKSCKRCYGAGFIPQFKHVQNGICFQCNGSRFYSSFGKIELSD